MLKILAAEFPNMRNYLFFLSVNVTIQPMCSKELNLEVISLQELS